MSSEQSERDRDDSLFMPYYEALPSMCVAELLCLAFLPCYLVDTRVHMCMLLTHVYMCIVPQMVRNRPLRVNTLRSKHTKHITADTQI